MLNVRITHNFAEIKAEYLEETVFKGEETQVLIDELKELVEELERWNED
jgi:hypothetical protein